MKRTKKLIILIFLLVLVIGLFLIIKYILSSSAKIKVVTTTSGSWLSPSKTYYYAVTKLGNLKCNEFVGNTENYFVGLNLKKSEHEDFSSKSSDYYLLRPYSNDEKIKDYVDNITELVSKKGLLYPEIGSLYLCSTRCFVSVLDNSPKMSFYEILYEYNIEENTLTEITRVKDQQIRQIYIKY